MSIPAVQVFVDSALTICFGSKWSDGTYDGNALCVAYFCKCLGQWFSTWGLFACFLWVSRAPGEYVHNLFLYFVFRTWNHFLPYPKQWDYLAVAQSIILFWRGWRQSLTFCVQLLLSATPVYFYNSWKLIEIISKNLTNFILWEAIASSLIFWLRYC